MRQFLEDAYPQITTIDAEQYPPPPVGLFAQQIAGMAQIATLALMIGGEGVFRLFGAPTPNWYGGFKENKMFAFGCVWMANNIAAGMVATGAFEIVVGDRTIYSKLETGRLPNAKDVIDGLRRVGLTTPLEAKYLGTAPRTEL